MPHQDLTLALLLRHFYEKGDRPRSLALCRELFQHGHNPENFMNAGIILNYYGLGEEAVAALKKAIPLAPDYKDPYWELGKFYVRQGKVEAAKSIWRRGLTLDPQDARFQGGFYQLQLGASPSVVPAVPSSIPPAPEPIRLRSRRPADG